MLLTQWLAFVASATVVTAAPAPAAGSGDIVITADDVVLHGNGRIQVMKRSEFKGLFGDYHAILANQTRHDANKVEHTEAQLNELKRNAKTKRDDRVILIPGRTDKFLDYDVQMSQIVKGIAGTGTRITIASGYSITNSLSINGGAEFNFVEDFFSASVDLTMTWETTSTQSQSLFADVPPGKFGCWVSNPLNTRTYLNIWKGQIGSPGSLQEVYVNKFTSRQYENLAWVDGLLQLCIGDQSPLPRCLGTGFL
ncbi:hypothetical protein ACJQWK_10481 [Exserohilum turcicum]|uniref:Uncharacterized protein n=1 Tax=Exserohilum turcicum (strain 28A) TaxID=671987 RepID=R0JXP9_EXST2|nr:uncharacterized protein SETTUDRAFT_29144 [Exserohilum turcica Et28A]EOA85683.1 hypothetical protein SETTUDRAFT_29144 [Exserohilum turcica Et28A]